MKQNTAILDIGSSKVICLICSAQGRDSITVRGAGVKEYPGFENGRFIDEQLFSSAVVDAIAMAEGEAKVRIRDLSVGVPASFSKLVLHEGAAGVKSRTGRINGDTIDDLTFEQPEGYELMHSTPVEFKIGETVTADPPLGQAAKEVSAVVSHVYMHNGFRAAVSDALSRTNLEADMYISFIRGSALIACETLGIGGVSFANDLAYGLRISTQSAENVKRRYVYSLDYQDSIDIVRMEGKSPMHVDHAVIQFIIEERTKQLAGYLVRMLKDMGVRLEEKPPVYITGGGIALMRGSCEYMEKLMGVPLKVRMPWMPRLSSPNYASAFSVMDFVMHAEEEDSVDRLVGMVSESRFIKKIRELFGNVR